MNLLMALLLACSPAAIKAGIRYTLHVDPSDLSGWIVEIRLTAPADTFRLAMAAHPEYDDRYRRYVRDFSVQSSGGRATFSQVDSAVWQVVAAPGMVTVRYRIALPQDPPGPRSAWKPFLTPTGGLFGGPHAFMYVIGGEHQPVVLTLDVPRDWVIATGLEHTTDPYLFRAANAAALIDAPILAGRLRTWRFTAAGVPHTIAYWPSPDATPFDTIALVSGVRAIVDQAIAVFDTTPYRDYTFQIQDGAWGALEHRNSVTLGAPSSALARADGLRDMLAETAHEFFHTWNLMAIQPVEYREIDYRTQPPVASLWFSEGLTMYYADLLRRRAGLPGDDSTRVGHLERRIASYLANPAYTHFSAEAISRVAYNAEPGALGDYSASTHLQGELIGTMLDLIIRDASGGRRSMDDVMRLLFARSSVGGRGGIDSHVIEHAVEETCGCDVTAFFDSNVRGAAVIDFNRYLALIGLQQQVTWAPALRDGQPEVDLRIWGWDPGDGSVRIAVSNPASIWGAAGLHSGDRLLRMNGAPVATWPELRARLQRLRLGDTVQVVVQRPAGPFTATVVVAGFERPTVTIVPAPSAGAGARRLGEAWLSGR